MSVHERVAETGGLYGDGTVGQRRGWDGHSWTREVSADSSVVRPETPGRLGFLSHRWFWVCVIGYVAGLALGVAADRTEVLWLAPLAGVGVLAVLMGFCLIAWLRLRLTEAIPARQVVMWGVVSGVVAYGIAWLVEGRLSGSLESALTGPIEETAKLLVPVMLYFALPKRFRDPRAGFALVLISASVVGLLEGLQYLWPQSVENITTYTGGGRPDTQSVSWSRDFQVLSMAAQRPVAELMHPILTGFVAAVAWFFAWHKGHRLFTWWAIGAWALAAALHSLNDAIPSSWPGALVLTCWLVILIGSYYLLYRRSARQLVPPTAVPDNPPGWRPHLDRSHALR